MGSSLHRATRSPSSRVIPLVPKPYTLYSISFTLYPILCTRVYRLFAVLFQEEFKQGLGFRV
jgi:hypothetical protein